MPVVSLKKLLLGSTAIVALGTLISVSPAMAATKTIASVDGTAPTDVTPAAAADVIVTGADTTYGVVDVNGATKTAVSLTVSNTPISLFVTNGNATAGTLAFTGDLNVNAAKVLTVVMGGGATNNFTSSGNQSVTIAGNFNGGATTTRGGTLTFRGTNTAAAATTGAITISGSTLATAVSVTGGSGGAADAGTQTATFGTTSSDTFNSTGFTVAGGAGSATAAKVGGASTVTVNAAATVGATGLAVTGGAGGANAAGSTGGAASLTFASTLDTTAGAIAVTGGAGSNNKGSGGAASLTLNDTVNGTGQTLTIAGGATNGTGLGGGASVTAKKNLTFTSITMTDTNVTGASLTLSGTSAQTIAGTIDGSGAGNGTLNVSNTSGGVTFSNDIGNTTGTLGAINVATTAASTTTATFNGVVKAANNITIGSGANNGTASATFAKTVAGSSIILGSGGTNTNTATFDASSASFTVTGTISGNAAGDTDNIVIAGGTGKTVTFASGMGGNVDSVTINAGTTLSNTGGGALTATTFTLGSGSAMNTDAAATVTGNVVAGSSGYGTLGVNQNTTLAGSAGTSTAGLAAINVFTGKVLTVTGAADRTIYASSISLVGAGSGLTLNASNTKTITVGNAITTGVNGQGALVLTTANDGATRNYVYSGDVGTSTLKLATMAAADNNDTVGIAAAGNLYVNAITLGTSDTLTMSGTSKTISGTIDGSAGGVGTLNITGTTTASGVIGGGSALAAVTVANGGTLTFMDNTTATATTVNNGGTLTVGASAKTITGTLANNGALNLGGYGTTVTGNITGTGDAAGTKNVITTTIGNTYATTGHIVATSGAAGPNFGTAVTITPTIGSTVIHNGDRVKLFDNTAAGAANPGTVNVTSSGLITWAYQNNWAGGAVADRFGAGNIANGDGVLTATVADATTVAGVSGQSAPALNALTAVATTADSNLLAVAGAAQTLTTGAATNDAGQQLTPDVNGASAQAAFGAVTGALTTVAARNDDLRLAQITKSGIASGEALYGAGIWAQGFGSFIDQGKRNDVDGYDAITGGASFGADKRVLRELRVGAAFSYAHTDVDDKGALKGSGQDVNSYIGTVYASYAGTPWYVDGNVSFGLDTFDTKRAVTFGGLNQTATASHDGLQVGVGGEAGYPVKLGKVITTPYASLAYNHLSQDSYTETGAPGANESVGSTDTYSLRSGLGVKASGTMSSNSTWTFKPNAHAAWLHEFNDNAPSSTSTFTATGGGSFTSPGLKLATEAGVIGFGMDMVSAKNVTLSAKYDFELRNEYMGHNAMLQARYDF